MKAFTKIIEKINSKFGTKMAVKSVFQKMPVCQQNKK